MMLDAYCPACARGERCALYWLVLAGLISAAKERSADA